MIKYPKSEPVVNVDKWAQAGKLIGVGFFIGGSIILGIVLGIWIDGKLNTRIFWLVGLLLGLGTAVWGVYRMVIPLLKNNNNHGGGTHR